jgi:hypothetical protein
MPRIIHDNSHHSGREFLVVIKDDYEPTLDRNTEPREIVLVNTIEGHFTIHRNGLIVKEQFCDQVLNCKKEDNDQIFLKITIGNTEQDFLTYQQELAIMYLSESLMDEYEITTFDSWVDNVTPDFFRRALEL